MFSRTGLQDLPLRIGECVLIEHPAVAEAAVVPTPDELRLAVPKAYIALAAGHEPSRDMALGSAAAGR
jgi:acyl-coenzyme A synthetase/AMP-(fatty) acid ligase